MNKSAPEKMAAIWDSGQEWHFYFSEESFDVAAEFVYDNLSSNEHEDDVWVVAKREAQKHFPAISMKTAEQIADEVLDIWKENERIDQLNGGCNE